MDYSARDIDMGWAWVVAVAVYAGRIVLSTSLYMSGIFYIALLEQYGQDEAKTSMIGSLNSGIMCLFGPVVSILIDSYSCRTSMFVGGFLLSISYIASSFNNNMDGLILTLGVIGGLANSMTSVPFSVSLGYYFHKRRNAVIASSMSVIGLAMFIASPLALHLLEEYGLKGTFLLVGGINAHLCVLAIICKPSSEEKKIRRAKVLKQLKDADEGHKPFWKRKHTIIKNISHIFSIRLLKNSAFILFMLSTASWNFMASVCLMHLPNYVITQGLPVSAITVIMTTFGVCNTLGRFLAALSVFRRGFDSLIFHIVTLGIAGVVTLTFRFYSHLNNGSYIFAGAIGLLTGIPNSLMTPISLKLVGVSNLSSAHGLENFFCGIGIVVGPPVAGVLYKSTRSYENSFMISGIVILIGCFAGILSFILARKHTPAEIIDVIDDEIGPTSELVSEDKTEERER